MFNGARMTKTSIQSPTYTYTVLSVTFADIPKARVLSVKEPGASKHGIALIFFGMPRASTAVTLMWRYPMVCARLSPQAICGWVSLLPYWDNLIQATMGKVVFYFSNQDGKALSGEYCCEWHDLLSDEFIITFDRILKSPYISILKHLPFEFRRILGVIIYA